MGCKSCYLLNKCVLNFSGRMDNGEKCIAFCCEEIENKPGMAFKLDRLPSEVIENFLKMRANIIMESIKAGRNGEEKYNRRVLEGCAKCPHFIKNEKVPRIVEKISYVNLSMYPAPCQSKCVYCSVHDTEMGYFDKEVHEKYYNKLFEILEYAKSHSIIDSDAVWQVSSGEITIHPYKKRIMDIVKNNRTVFYTNGFIFDKDIADNLSNNPNMAINLSIDAGTPETWLKVKGINNFETVMNNLKKYFSNTTRPGQILLKYIILPGINDNINDFVSVIKIMKELQCDHLSISRNYQTKYVNESEETDALIQAAGELLALLFKSGMEADIITYTPGEIEKINALAKKINSK